MIRMKYIRQRIQACFTLLHSADKCVLYRFKICGNSELNKSIGTILSNSISSVHVSVSHFGNSYNIFKINFSVQFSSITQSCPTFCDPMDCCTPGFPVHHQLPEPTQTHVHWVGEAIQPSHPLSSPSPPAFSLSQHQSLFKQVRSSHRLAKILEFKLQHQSFQWISRTDFL